MAHLKKQSLLDVVWDMETNDPDDFLTLLLLLGHPKVRLRGVTITPGSKHQVGLVRWALAQFDQDIPVGAGNIDHPKPSISQWHFDAYGDIPPSSDALEADKLLYELCDKNTTLITGAPLKNLGAALKLGEFEVGRWIAQGGFAGQGVVPPEDQLPKFKGLVTCPTFNLNGKPKASLAALDHPGFGIRRFVSKNVCHGVVYDQPMHTFVEPFRKRSQSLELIWQGMDTFLGNTGKSGEGSGKKLHDPLAACCAIEPDIATWAEVRLFRSKGKWGSYLEPGSNTWITVGYDHEKFLEILTMVGDE